MRSDIYAPKDAKLPQGVRRQLSCPVRDNYDGRLGGFTFYSLQPV